MCWVLTSIIPPHIYGSTHNESRIIRKAYFEGVQYAPLLARAYELWGTLEDETSQQLLELCGCLNIGSKDSTLVAEAQSTAETLGLDLEVLSPAEVTMKFPGYYIPESFVAVLTKKRVIFIRNAVWPSHLKLAQSRGAHCRFNEPIRTWRRDGDAVSVSTDRDTFKAQRVIFTVGAWMRDFVRYH